MNEIYIKTSDLNKWISKYFPNKDLISITELIGCIEDLDIEIDNLNQQLEEIKEDITDNYKRKTVAEQVGISDSDFY